MDDQADEEDDEEVVCVPEDLEVGPADDLHGRGDDEDEAERDDDAGNSRQAGHGEVGGVLLRVLRPREPRRTHKGSTLKYCVCVCVL